MASSIGFVEYVAEQCRGAGEISFRKMFGEYGLYCGGKLFALVCDNELFVKITERTKELYSALPEKPPYDGAKNYFLVENVDDRELLTGLVTLTCAALPEPTLKNRKPKRRSKMPFGPERNKVIVICGPTASGKTALAVELAKQYNGEVISADSMQIYTDMDIASAKPTAEEQQGIPHHLIGFLDPSESFSVAEYVKLCDRCVRDILDRGKLPIICGGTGLYISSFADNLTFDDSQQDFAYRDEMRKFAERYGNAALLEKLRQIDPATAETLHENNVGRIIRALEVYHTTGHTISQAKAMSRQAPSPYEFVMIALEHEDREILRDRINRRVDDMVERGLVEEARVCFEQPDRPTAAQAIGCKELYPYFLGERSLEECIEELKLRTRQYAKRQMTWFRRDERITHLKIGKNDELSDVVQKAKDIIDRAKA